MAWAAKIEIPSFYVFAKKHYCPICGEQMVVIKKSKVIVPGTEAAKEFSLAGLGGCAPLYPNIKFVWYAFYCLDCKISIKAEKKRLKDKAAKKKARKEKRLEKKQARKAKNKQN